MQDVNKINKNIGKNLKTLRTAKNLTQEQLAEKVNLERKSITAIETGRTFISCEVLANFSNYFNVEPSYFFKANFDDFGGDNKEIKTEINRLLSDCSYEDLEKYYNILVALKKP